MRIAKSLPVLLLPCLLLTAAAPFASAAEPLPALIDIWGTFGSGPGQFGYPGGVCVEGNDYVYVADQGNNRIQKFRPDGSFVMQWGQMGSGPGDLFHPARVHLAANGELYVTEHQNHRVSRFTTSGAFLGFFAHAGSGQVVYPVGISTDSNGSIYVVGATSSQVKKFSSTGTFLGAFGDVSGAYGCYVADDLVYVAEYYGNRVQVFDTGGNFLFAFGTEGTGPGQFRAAEATVQDFDGNLYVVDTGNDRVQKLTPNGSYLGEFPVPPSDEAERRPIPCDVAISPDGHMYVVGFGSARLYQYVLTGEGNDPPDCRGAIATIDREWPLNQKLVPVTISGITDPEGDPVTVRVVAITQDEPLVGHRGLPREQPGPGNRLPEQVLGGAAPDLAPVLSPEDEDEDLELLRRREHCPDAEIDAQGRAKVRLEAIRRSHGGNGRVYRLAFEATDGLATCRGTVDVCLPLRPGASCVDDGQDVNSLGPCPTEGLASEPIGEVQLGAAERDPHRFSVEYYVPFRSEVQIGIFDVSGRRVASLGQGSKERGLHRVDWNAASFARGVYFMQIRSGAGIQRKTLIVR
jgi:DNA-binding beta-propeller fold protein YncE